MKFTKEQHKVWSILFGRQLELVKRHACRDYLRGFEILALSPDRIPTLEELNEKITPRTGWKVVRTQVRYPDAHTWYESFARREHLVPHYIRTLDELDFTPEPDMFHDIFGHLPYFTLPKYTKMVQLFAPAFLRATTDEQRENVKRFAWFSHEFGLIAEGLQIKAFGAGLMSSYEEMNNVMEGRVPLKLFIKENVCKREKAIWSLNKELFIFDSIEGLYEETERYFSTW